MLKQEYSLVTLADSINNLPSGYENKLVGTDLIHAAEHEEALAKWVNGLTDSELIQLIQLLTDEGICNYKKYFL